MDVTLITLSLTAITIAIYYFCFRGSSFFKTHNIPHLKPWPFFGNSGYQLFRKLSLAELIEKVYNLNPECKYVGFYEFLTPIVMIRDPELIKQVGVKHFEHFPDHRSFIDESIDPLFAKNLFSTRGQRWKQYRTMLSPAFSSAKMKTMFKLMEHCAVDFSEFIVDENEEGVELEMKDIFTRYTNDVLATCAFGIRVDSMRDPDNEFYALGKNITAFTFTRTLKFFMIRGAPWLARILGLKFVVDRTAKFFKNIVKTTIETRDEKGISRPDMIQLMMETRGKRKDDLTIEEMTAQAFIFFFAGFDTTSTLMCFLCYEIAVNEHIQKTLRDEVDEVLQQTAGAPTYEAINGMKYLEAVINEALRLWPVAAVVDRLCAKDFELPPTLPGEKPFVIKKGMGIWFPIYGIQRDPKYFENPQKFDPNRFLDQEKNHIDSVTYMPFGVGPRMCIGNRFALLETKALVFHLLARVELQPCSRTTIPLKLAKRGFMMKAEGGFWMKFVPRNNPYLKRSDVSSMTDE